MTTIADFSRRLALHTWTLDTTPFPDVLAVARDAGWQAIELRRGDIVQAYRRGQSREDVIRTLNDSGIAIATMGAEYGIVFAQGDELKRLLDVLDETCLIAKAVGCKVIMTATGADSGSDALAATNLRAAGDVVARHGMRLAWEYSAAHPTINRLGHQREIHAKVNHPAVGLLLDAYHLERSGDGGASFADMPPAHIVAFQYSDVPPTPLGGMRPVDRLAPGQGVVRWREVLTLLAAKNFEGYLSYEAPNPASFARSAAEVAAEGLRLTREMLAGMTE
jgi:2-keto-myo-inositol isomerase